MSVRCYFYPLFLPIECTCISAPRHYQRLLGAGMRRGLWEAEAPPASPWGLNLPFELCSGPCPAPPAHCLLDAPARCVTVI